MILSAELLGRPNRTGLLVAFAGQIRVLKPSKYVTVSCRQLGARALLMVRIFDCLSGGEG